MTTLLLGCDFSSAPTARKPIVVALGQERGGRVTLSHLLPFTTLDAWGQWLNDTPAWLGGFDLPFGLSRELVMQLGWPATWPELMAHYAAMSRAEIRTIFAAFCAGSQQPNSRQRPLPLSYSATRRLRPCRWRGRS